MEEKREDTQVPALQLQEGLGEAVVWLNGWCRRGCDQEPLREGDVVEDMQEPHICIPAFVFWLSWSLVSVPGASPSPLLALTTVVLSAPPSLEPLACPPPFLSRCHVSQLCTFPHECIPTPIHASCPCGGLTAAKVPGAALGEPSFSCCAHFLSELLMFIAGSSSMETRAHGHWGWGGGKRGWGLEMQ